MYQHNLIKHLEEIENAVLVRAMMYPQLSYFTPDNVGIGPLEIRPLLLQERQVAATLARDFLSNPSRKSSSSETPGSAV